MDENARTLAPGEIVPAWASAMRAQIEELGGRVSRIEARMTAAVLIGAGGAQALIYLFERLSQ